jgi:hypothetical protein
MGGEFISGTAFQTTRNHFMAYFIGLYALFRLPCMERRFISSAGEIPPPGELFGRRREPSIL